MRPKLRLMPRLSPLDSVRRMKKKFRLLLIKHKRLSRIRLLHLKLCCSGLERMKSKFRKSSNKLKMLLKLKLPAPSRLT